RVHVHLVMKEICRPLQTFSDWRELVSVVRDALRAHQSAWEDHGILHRDISVDNIFIYERPHSGVTGLLANWDKAKRRTLVLNPTTLESSRSGTWQFLSAGLVTYPNKPHVLSDDLESVIHILNCLAMKHLRTDHSRSPEALTQLMEDIYDTRLDTGEGGHFKWLYVRSGSGFKFFAHRHSRKYPFIALLAELSKLCRLQYERLT
ncbi:hypothetical protein GY45DRAFT_1218667, partial [Cubamyces sp. BRFM 1775]